MAPLHSLVQDNQHGVQHNCFVYVMPLALVPCDAESDTNGIIAFLMLRQNKVQHDFFGHVILLPSVSHDTNGIVNDT